MVKKVLGILGSPCLEGNTAALLDAALEGAAKAGHAVERMDLARMDISPCKACGDCSSSMTCSQNDDMTRIYQNVREIDAMVLASPIFFMGVTAQTKAMIDRCQCYWYEKYVLKKRAYEGRRRPKGLFVSCAGSSKQIVFDPARHVVKSFFAALDYEYAGEVLMANTDDPDLNARKETVLEEARAAGRRICQ
jgi:multimeric flavodoxin WrbA